jgi:glycosyltransferase involved in cell wall biosynthesis
MIGLQPTYIDVTNTLQARSITGIQRVTAEVLRRPRTARIRGFELVPVTRDAIGWRRLTDAEHDRLRLGPTASRGGIRRTVNESPFAGALSSLRGWVPGRPARAPRRVVASVPNHLRAPVFEAGSLFFDCEASWHNQPARAELLPLLQAAGTTTAMLGLDALPFERPEWFVPVIGQKFRDHVGAHLHAGSFVVCISEDTRSRLAAIAHDLDAPTLDGAVMPLGSDWPAPTAELTSPPGVPERFVLCVGTVEPRKNHGMLLDAWERLEAMDSDRERGSVGLVIVGRLGWQSDELARRLRRLHRSDRRVQWLRTVDDAQLAALYREATVVVMPSLDEGLGLPVLEARRNAVPVLASNRGGLPEALGGGGWLLDPEDVDGWSRAMATLLDDEVQRQMVVHASAADPPPTWDDAADQLWSLMRKVASPI